MARRDPDDLGRKKSSAADKAEEQDEEALEQKEAREQKSDQTRDSAQDAMGNEAVQAMMGMVGVQAGEAGQGTDLAERKEEQSVGVDYGGDDAPTDAPISFEDLVRSWNPGTRRGQDSAPFREKVGTEDLGPPDPEVASLPLGNEPRPAGVRLSAAAAATAPTLATRAALRLTGGSALGRCWGRLVAPPRGPLLDPHGRVAVVRTRTLALVALLAEDTISQASPSDRPALVGAVSFLLELASRRRVLEALADRLVDSKEQLPKTAALVAAELEGLPAGEGTGRSPSVELIEQLRGVLQDLSPHAPAVGLLPDLPTVVEPTEVEDDPLGLDTILSGGKVVDPLAGRYELQLLVAEKLAVACNVLRVDSAGFVLATRAALGDAAVGPILERTAASLDDEVGKVLQLLVEVARAIQQRTVPPQGVRNGLRRAARGLDLAFTQLCGWLAGAVAAAIPPAPGLLLPPLAGPDPLDALLDDGELAQARVLLLDRPDGVASAWFLESLDRRLAREAVDPMELARAARAAGREALARAVELVALFRTPYEGLATHVRQEALAAGDDLACAAATMVLLDRSPDPRELRLDTCARLAAWGPSAGLELLARWAPPDQDDTLDEGAEPG